MAAAPAFAQGAGKSKTEVTWYGHAAFVVKAPGGTTLAIDPWINNPFNQDKPALDKTQKVDFILISHGHFDRVGEAVALQRKTTPRSSRRSSWARWRRRRAEGGDGIRYIGQRGRSAEAER
jgi:L-ascorbate metabolism protein UlaG (beta-lactamase superfamily)